MSNIRTCTHIKVTGVRCGSPALRGEEYCYFHYRMLCESRVSHVALLENEEAIQVSLMEIVNSLLRGTIDLKRGELVLRALNTAVRNIRRARFEKATGMVRELPEDPVVPPRPRPLSSEEIQAMQKQVLAEYYASKKEQPPAPTTKAVGTAALPATPSVGAQAANPERDRGARPTPTQAVHEKPTTVHVGAAGPGCQRGPAVSVRSNDPKQRKPPAGVKKIPAAAKSQAASAAKSLSVAIARAKTAAAP